MNDLTEGERAFTEQLYRDCFTPLFRFLFARTNDEDVAADLTQQCFLKFMKQEHVPLEALHAKNLLYVIAKTTLIDHWRKSGRELLVDMNELDVEDGNIPNPIEDEVTRECVDGVRAVILTLSDREQDVVLMRNNDEMEYSEIANALGIDVANARKIYSRALQKIEVRLRASNVFP